MFSRIISMTYRYVRNKMEVKQSIGLVTAYLLKM